MNHSVVRRPAAAKTQPSLQQQLASGKRAKATRQAQQAQGRRKAAADAPSDVAASMGANVAGASHISASRLLALLTQPSAAAPAVQAQPQPTSVLRAQDINRGAAAAVFPITTPYTAAPIAAAIAHSPFSVAPSFINDNRRRQMGSSIFNSDTAPSPALPSQPSHVTSQITYQHQQPPQLTAAYPSSSNFTPYQPPTIQHQQQQQQQQQQPTPLALHTGASHLAADTQPLAASPVGGAAGRSSWGGGGRSLEAGDGARDAAWQKKMEMRASLDAQMKEKEEKKRLDKLQAKTDSSRAQEHWLDASHPPQSQPSPANHPSHTSNGQLTASTPASHSQASPTATAQPYSFEPATSRSSHHSTAHPSNTSIASSGSMSSIRSHNQSSSIFTAAGNETADQRKAAVRQEVQEALRAQMEDKKRREEERKKKEADEERKWEEKLERERGELASARNGAARVVAEERKEAPVVSATGNGSRASAVGGAGAQEEKQQLTVRGRKSEKEEKKRASSESESSDSDHSDRRTKHSKNRKASRERSNRRSKHRHSNSDDSVSSQSDSDDHRSRRRKSSRHRSRRRERRSRYSSESESERVEDECIYVADSAYTHRLRYEQEQREIDQSTISTSTSRRSSSSSSSSSTNHKSKPNSASSSHATTPTATQKPPFGVRSLQTRAQPKAPTARVRVAPAPLPAGDTRAGKQALSAARLAMGRTSGGSDKFVSQKWKEKKAVPPAAAGGRAQQAAAPDDTPTPRTADSGRGSGREGGRMDAGGGGGGGVGEQLVVPSMQELSLADRLDSTSEWLLPHSLGLPSYRG